MGMRLRKVCPQCSTVIHARRSVCEYGHAFTLKREARITASSPAKRKRVLESLEDTLRRQESNNTSSVEILRMHVGMPKVCTLVLFIYNCNNGAFHDSVGGCGRSRSRCRSRNRSRSRRGCTQKPKVPGLPSVWRLLSFGCFLGPYKQFPFSTQPVARNVFPGTTSPPRIQHM